MDISQYSLSGYVKIHGIVVQVGDTWNTEEYSVLVAHLVDGLKEYAVSHPFVSDSRLQEKKNITTAVAHH